MISKKEHKNIRHNRIRLKVRGTTEKPRLSIFKSGRYIYAQIINDEHAKTVVASSDLKKIADIKNDENMSIKIKKAFNVGMDIAQKATAKKIKNVVFDRGGYRYHGRVKALAEGARKGGLVF